MFAASHLSTDFETTVPVEHYFFMGDNRNDSQIAGSHKSASFPKKISWGEHRGFGWIGIFQALHTGIASESSSNDSSLSRHPESNARARCQAGRASHRAT